MKKRILVVDDTQRHLDAALQQFDPEQYEVVTVSSYWDALILLSPQKIVRMGWDERSIDCFRTDIYPRRLAPVPEPFDIVLTDLIMPALENGLGTEAKKFLGQEGPYGAMVALAALQAGVPMIAVASVSNHHAHPAAAAYDFLTSHSFGSPIECEYTKMFELGRSRIITVNCPTLDGGTPETWVKNWAAVVERLEEKVGNPAVK